MLCKSKGGLISELSKGDFMLEVRYPKQMIYLFLSLTEIMTKMKRFWDLVTLKNTFSFRLLQNTKFGINISYPTLSKNFLCRNKYPFGVFFSHVLYAKGHD